MECFPHNAQTGCDKFIKPTSQLQITQLAPSQAQEVHMEN